MSDSNTKTAVITAVLTGVFTVLAGLATYWITTKDPELSYTVVGGPTLPATSGLKRIFVVEVRNSGKKEIPSAYVQLGLPEGELSEIATEASPGVKLNEERSPKQISLTADLLNPGDQVKVSFLTTLTSAASEPRVTVRAAGVKATDVSTRKRALLDGNGHEELSLLLVPALAAVLSTFVLLMKSPLGSVLGFPTLMNRLHPSEVTAFVCGACALDAEAESLRFGGPEVTYRGTADYLLLCAKRVAPESSIRYRTALKAMLLNDGLSSSAVKSILLAFELITGSAMDEHELNRLKKLSIAEEADPVAWRRAVISFVDAELSGS